MALQVIRDNKRTNDIVTAAAATLLEANQRRISARTYTCLLRHARRLAIVRGPVMDLLRLSVSTESPPSKAKT